MKKFLYILPLAAMAVACSPKSNTSVPQPEAMPVDVADSRPNLVRLKATVFKMNADYADKVAVTLGQNGELSYFPAPSDINVDSAPVEIGDGWWLNRQGISANSVFTKYTFEEYHNLKSVPTPAEIKAMIIPGSGVTDFRQLVLPASEARNLPPSELLKYIKDLTR